MARHSGIKIAAKLASIRAVGGAEALHILDEPTTGLHLEDIRRLANVLDRLVDQGHTLVLIEHNLDVIKLADWVVSTSVPRPVCAEVAGSSPPGAARGSGRGRASSCRTLAEHGPAEAEQAS